MITNTYKCDGPLHRATVTEHDYGELRCSCPAWKQSQMEVEQVGSAFPIAVCQHLLTVQKQELDAGFLAHCDGYQTLYVGWVTQPGGFVPVTLYRVEGESFWYVLLPLDVAPAAPTFDSTNPFDGQGMAHGGIVLPRAGRRDIAQAVAPFYASYGEHACCSKCKQPGEWLSSRPPEGLLDNTYRMECLLWGVQLQQHGGLCVNCDTSDLLPRI